MPIFTGVANLTSSGSPLTTVYVDASNYPTIQNAVDAAALLISDAPNEGLSAVVIIPSGYFDESVTIGRNISLVGQGRSVSIIRQIVIRPTGTLTADAPSIMNLTDLGIGNAHNLVANIGLVASNETAVGSGIFNTNMWGEGGLQISNCKIVQTTLENTGLYMEDTEIVITHTMLNCSSEHVACFILDTIINGNDSSGGSGAGTNYFDICSLYGTITLSQTGGTGRPTFNTFNCNIGALTANDNTDFSINGGTISAKTVNGSNHNIVYVSNSPYTQTTPANWTTNPQIVDTALDELAARANITDGDKGDITVSSSGVTWTIDNKAVTLAKQADIATASFIGRNTAGTGIQEVLSEATAKTMLNLSGTNTGDQTITLTGDVTGSGTGSFSTSVAKINGTTVSGTTGSTNVVFSTGPTLSNPIVGTQSQTDNSTKAASTAYVTAAIANAVSGVNPAIAVQAATTAAGDTSGLTYSNGVSGIGATLTGTNNTAIVIDGYTFNALNQRLLVKNDTQSPSGAFNGIYYLSQLQGVALPPILVRALDYDTSSDMNNTGAIPVINGTVNGTTSWVLTSQVTTVGTDPLTFTRFTRNPSDYLLVSNNLSDLGTRQTALNNLAGAVTSTQYLRGNGTNISMSAIQAGDVPTLNQNTTGSAAKWTTARNLAGNSTDGSADISFANKFIVQGTADSGLSAAQFMGALGTGIVKNTTSTGVLSIAVAGDFPTLNQNTTGTATNATNAVNIGITDDTTTNAIMYPTWVTTTSGNLPQKISSTKLTFNPNTATLTTTTFSGALSGNATTATTLQTGRTINGTTFDGSINITITAAAGTLTGNTLASGVTASSLTSVGTLSNLTVTNPISGSITGNAATVTTNANLTGPVTSSGNATTISAGVVTEAMQVLADNTTANVSTTAHGYAPKAPNDTTQFLRGDAAWSALPDLAQTNNNPSVTETVSANYSAYVVYDYLIPSGFELVLSSNSDFLIC